MPKIVDHDKRREEIMNKAIPIFAREGFHKTNLAMIADACGLQRTAIYRYFSDKNEIFQYTINAIFTMIEDSAASAGQSAKGSALARLELVMNDICRTTMDHTQHISIILDLWLQIKRDNEPTSQLLRQRVDRLIAKLEGIIKSGVDSGEFRPLDTKAMAYALFLYLESFSMHASLLDTPDIEPFIASTHILISGLLAQD